MGKTRPYDQEEVDSLVSLAVAGYEIHGAKHDEIVRDTRWNWFILGVLAPQVLEWIVDLLRLLF